MDMRAVRRVIAPAVFSAVFFVCAAGANERGEVIPFDSDAWVRNGSEVVTHLGRPALKGTAYVKEVEFQDGVIEVDVAVTGSRSYPGVVFRRQSKDDYERFYIRPHRAGLYPDALQYTPSFKGVSGWQLYHGKGFTAGAEIPTDRWVRLRIEVKGTQARVYWGEGEKPALEIGELKHGISKGVVGVMGPNDGSAYFSKFRCWEDDSLEFGEALAAEKPEGMITDWEVSRPFLASQMNLEAYPQFYQIFYGRWQEVQSEPSGLVNISRHVPRTGAGPDVVMARKVFRSDEKQTVRLSFGYSDDVTMFFNGKPVFAGASGYRTRDRSFLGIVGLNDMVYLPAEKGLNEILLLVTETFGGWGFMCQADRTLAGPVREDGRLKKVWETESVFRIPESVVYDAERDVLYVSSFDKLRRSSQNTGFISRVGLDGEVRDLEWVTGLDGPCGMGICGQRLYVVEGVAGNLVEIDIPSGEVEQRYPIEGFQFLNDVAVDGVGRVYISNTSRELHDTDIYVFQDGAYEVWKGGDELHRSNGLFVHGNTLIVGSVGDGRLKAVGLDDRRVDEVTSLGAGVIDGIRVDKAGNYLVSHWRGKVYAISPEGSVVEILDTAPAGWNVADFEYVSHRDLLVIPTFLGNRVVGYELAAG